MKTMFGAVAGGDAEHQEGFMASRHVGGFDVHRSASSSQSRTHSTDDVALQLAEHWMTPHATMSGSGDGSSSDSDLCNAAAHGAAGRAPHRSDAGTAVMHAHDTAMAPASRRLLPVMTAGHRLPRLPGGAGGENWHEAAPGRHVAPMHVTPYITRATTCPACPPTGATSGTAPAVGTHSSLMGGPSLGAAHSLAGGAAAGAAHTMLMPAASAPPPLAPSFTQTSSATGSGNVRVVLHQGGAFQRTGREVHYEGGKRRLVQLRRCAGLPDLLQLTGVCAPGVTMWQPPPGVLLRYALPGSQGGFIELEGQEDADTMWEEWEEWALHQRGAAGKLELFVEVPAAVPAEQPPPPPLQPPSPTARTHPPVRRAATFGDPPINALRGTAPPLEAARAISAPGDCSTLAGARAAVQALLLPCEPGCAEGEPRAWLSPREDEERQQQQLQLQQQASQEDLHSQLRNAVHGLNGKVEVLRPWELSVMRLLGAGAFGEVYLARWHGSEVAVKCLPPRLLGGDGLGAPDGKAVAELLTEATLLAGLHHPNVLSVYGIVLPPACILPEMSAGGNVVSGPCADSGALAGAAQRGTLPSDCIRPPALVVEHMPGGSLRQRLDNGAKWLVNSSRAKVKIMYDCAKGLKYLHRKRICHFDLKSANLLVGFSAAVPYVKVSDFGLSKRRNNTYVSGLDSLRGTLPWMAPEILHSPDSVTERCDVYSFGVIMWEVWTGREPYADLPPHALLHQLSLGGAQAPALAVPGSGDWDGPDVAEPAPGWAALMQACWSRDPAARPSSSQLVQALEAMMASVQAQPPAAPATAAGTASAAEVAPAGCTRGPASS